MLFGLTHREGTTDAVGAGLLHHAYICQTGGDSIRLTPKPSPEGA